MALTERTWFVLFLAIVVIGLPLLMFIAPTIVN